MSRWLRAVLALSLLMNVLVLAGVGVYVSRRGVPVVEQKLGLADAPRPDFTALGHERFGPLPGAPVAFVGDSEVQNAPLAEVVGKVAQRGIGGQTVADTAGWLDVVLDDPELRRLVVWAGTNDVLEGKPAEQSATDMRALLAHVTSARPDVSVVLLSVPPLRAYRSQAAAMNAALRRVAGQGGAGWVDVDPPLRGDRMLDTDGVHVTPAGYVAIGDLLRQAAG